LQEQALRLSWLGRRVLPTNPRLGWLACLWHFRLQLLPARAAGVLDRGMVGRLEEERAEGIKELFLVRLKACFFRLKPNRFRLKPSESQEDFPCPRAG
jgi:hypothetical protein